MPKTVFYPVLNMGLGHASRSLPLIRELLLRGWKVLIGSNGRALSFLRGEVPQAEFVETPSYAIRYSKRGWFAIKLFLQMPRVFGKVWEERRFIKKLVKSRPIDLIISDQCYGMYHRGIPSFFISHQIVFEVPRQVQWLKAILARMNAYYHYRFKEVWIPDLADPSGERGVLSGELSRAGDPARYRFIGLLSSVVRREVARDIDLFVTVSGPEPQRTLLEELIMGQIRNISGQKVVVLGKPESSEAVVDEPGLKVYSHLSRDKMQDILNRSRMVVSRSGYSTLMELVELGIPALFIPTPGQTEQEYLGELLREKVWYFSVHQKDFDLVADLEQARQFPGFIEDNPTAGTLERLFQRVPELR